MAARQARLRNSNNFLAYIFYLFNQALALRGDSRLECHLILPFILLYKLNYNDYQIKVEPGEHFAHFC